MLYLRAICQRGHGKKPLKDEPEENDQKKPSKKEELIQKIKNLRAELNATETEFYKVLDEERLKNDMKAFKDDLQMQVIGDSVIILRGGIKQDYPREFLDKVVKYVKKTLGKDENYQVMEFTEVTLDNPWVRVLVINANTMDFLDDFDDIKNKIKV